MDTASTGGIYRGCDWWECQGEEYAGGEGVGGKVWGGRGYHCLAYKLAEAQAFVMTI